MSAEIRAATPLDLPQMVDLLLQKAEWRRRHDPSLWTLAEDARQRTADDLSLALTKDKQPFRQTWLVAEVVDTLVGVIHSLRLPVPPIYAGNWGDPGLLMPETLVAQDAPPGTLETLVRAAETDLRASGAALFLASFTPGEERDRAYRSAGYEPLTLYLAKSGLQPARQPDNVRSGTDQDIDAIVIQSARHRKTLHQLDPFWEPHDQADARFGNWMRKSLALPDRDMFVSGSHQGLYGYVVAQPASRLHFPPAHDIAAVGVIDDFFHQQFADPARMRGDGVAAHALLRAAEASFAARGVTTALVVCPAAWTSKARLLEDAGYGTAMVWMIKR